MRNLLVTLFVVLFALSAFAQGTALAATEFSGSIEVSSTENDAGETVTTIILYKNEKSYLLVVADAVKSAELEALAGRDVIVTGEMVASTEAEELDTIKVASWVVTAPSADEELVIDDELDTDDAPDAE